MGSVVSQACCGVSPCLRGHVGDETCGARTLLQECGSLGLDICDSSKFPCGAAMAAMAAAADILPGPDGGGRSPGPGMRRKLSGNCLVVSDCVASEDVSSSPSSPFCSSSDCSSVVISPQDLSLISRAILPPRSINRLTSSSSYSDEDSAKTAKTKMNNTAPFSEASTLITDLPEVLICEVLGRLERPEDVCRVATVCSLFAHAARNDMTWQHFLPRVYYQLGLLSRHSAGGGDGAGGRHSHSRRKHRQRKKGSYHLYDDHGGTAKGDGGWRTSFRRLREGFVDPESPLVHYRLDPSTGVVTTSCSAMGMVITVREYPPYPEFGYFWNITLIKGSVFEQGIALRVDPYGFKVSGTLTCTVPRGRYMCSWRLSVDPPSYDGANFWDGPDERWYEGTVQVVGGPVVERAVKSSVRSISDYSSLTEVDIGVVQITGDHCDPDNDRRNDSNRTATGLGGKVNGGEELVRITVNFRLVTYDGGLVLDSFVLRPVTDQEDDLLGDQGEWEEGRRRGREGSMEEGEEGEEEEEEEGEEEEKEEKEEKEAEEEKEKSLRLRHKGDE
ncbi:hypothetical protein CBR_g46312 [Chara braunii]|uniref:F-box domain-containing protein n=1 Tax=Chara braunii TaxID=69332 RepID=A0A388M067_CHABU|nr:hypothetical protein CBR_g46312 [Chara braunii]|eukprot:GBG87946.1 hypothetical protein CBR_g46312 [Chara braunii]